MSSSPKIKKRLAEIQRLEALGIYQKPGDTMKHLKNQYNNYQLKKGIPAGFVHIDEKRLTAFCRKIEIGYVEVVDGFTRSGKYCNPNMRGILVSKADAPFVLAYLKEKKEKEELHEQRKRLRSIRAAGPQTGSGESQGSGHKVASPVDSRQAVTGCVLCDSGVEVEDRDERSHPDRRD
jgi:hypothetical protein